MKKIGISGGIGSGKSIVCKIFEVLGVPVYYADEQAKWLTNNDLQLRKEIKELLGRMAYDQNGQYNRKWVASQVFSNPDLLKQLNQLIHPRVFDDTERWLKKYPDKPYIIREAALVNSKQESNLDVLIVVSSPLDLRINRIKKRDPHRSDEEILAIISRQKTDEQFSEIADYQIFNDEKQFLIRQVLAVHEKILN